MNESNIVSEWLEIAYDDYDTAQYLYDNKYNKPLEIICYHCQQSAEKSLKAYLCSRGIEVPKTHEVGLLCHRCAEFNDSFSEFFEDCDEIEIYATLTRYPSRIDIEDSHAQKALQQAQSIYTFVSELIQQLFNNLAEVKEQETDSGPQMNI